MLADFNLLATTFRGAERDACAELQYLLGQAGDASPKVTETFVTGLVTARTSLDPLEVIGKLREIIKERPYEFRFMLRLIPINTVVRTDLNEIRGVTAKYDSEIGESETFRVTVEKRFADLSSQEVVKAVATDIKKKVDLDNPDKIVLIEIVGGLTGISLLTPSDVMCIAKEKLL
jgi:tRNA acetyltransferase TAN1